LNKRKTQTNLLIHQQSITAISGYTLKIQALILGITLHDAKNNK
jgi:hypothetical protein